MNTGSTPAKFTWPPTHPARGEEIISQEKMSHGPHIKTTRSSAIPPGEPPHTRSSLHLLRTAAYLQACRGLRLNLDVSSLGENPEWTCVSFWPFNPPHPHPSSPAPEREPAKRAANRILELLVASQSLPPSLIFRHHESLLNLIWRFDTDWNLKQQPPFVNYKALSAVIELYMHTTTRHQPWKEKTSLGWKKYFKLKENP